ncbi:hypothetical protein Bbelb_328110 [Branchiostoma belcheri]|nr:hypothetical protein Bbelb_328110 [Branchiostoma belcheri]
MFHSDAPTRQHNRLDVTSNGHKNQPLFAYTMASLAKLFTRCLSLSSQVLPARGLHIPAEGSGEAGETDSGTRPAEPPPPRMLTARLQCQRNAAALDGAEDALNVHGEPTGSALKLLEAAEAFNVSQPANWCLKVRQDRSHAQARFWIVHAYPELSTQVRTWKSGPSATANLSRRSKQRTAPCRAGHNILPLCTRQTVNNIDTVQRRASNIDTVTTGQQHLTPYNDGTTTSYTKSVVGGGTKPGGNPAFFRLLPPQSGIMTHQQPDSGHNSTSCHGRYTALPTYPRLQLVLPKGWSFLRCLLVGRPFFLTGETED